MKQLVARLWKGQEGQGLTEYGLILALVAVVVIGVLTAMGGQIKAIFNQVIGGLGGQPVQ